MAYTIYLSSTYQDLKAERAQLRSRLNESGYEVNCMERYPPAFTNDIRVKCEEDVRKCDIYLCIIGDQYGSLVPGEDGTPLNCSYTEYEFEAAVRFGKKRFVFLTNKHIDDDHQSRFIARITDPRKTLPRFDGIGDLIPAVLSSLSYEFLNGQSQRKLLPGHAKYTCDRAPHFTRFNMSLLNQDRNKHNFLIYGDARNGHKMFADRCISFLKVKYPAGILDITFYGAVNMPSSPEKIVSDLKYKIIGAIISKAPLADRTIADFSAESIFNYLAGIQTDCLVIRMVIRSDQVSKHTKLYTRAVTMLLSEISALAVPAHQKIVFFFHLEYERADDGDEVAAAFIGEPAYQEIALEPLSKVSRSDVLEWMEQNFQYDENAAYGRMMDLLFPNTLKDGADVFMDDIARSLEDAVEAYNRSKLT